MGPPVTSQSLPLMGGMKLAACNDMHASTPPCDGMVDNPEIRALVSQIQISDTTINYTTLNYLKPARLLLVWYIPCTCAPACCGLSGPPRVAWLVHSFADFAGPFVVSSRRGFYRVNHCMVLRLTWDLRSPRSHFP